MKLGSLFIAGAIAGLSMAVLSNLPLVAYGNCLGCMWLWLSGILGAFIYRNSAHSVTGGQGAVVGFLSGIFGAIVGAVLGAIFGTIGWTSVFSSTLSSVDPSLAGGVEETLVPSLLSGGSLGTGFALLSLCFTIFLFPLFGAIGGAVGGVIFARPAPATQVTEIVQ